MFRRTSEHLRHQGARCNSVDVEFNSRHAWDGWFWAFVLASALILVIMAFREPVSARIAGASPPATWALIFHVWSAVGWLLLLSIQAVLVARGRLRWHRALGRMMLPLTVVIISSGTLTQIQGDRLRMDERPELLSFTIVPVSYLAMFGALAIAAWMFRRRPAVHKRLVLLATGSLMAGAFIRALGPVLFPILPNSAFSELLINYGGTLIFAVLGIGYDLGTRGAAHRVYGIAVPLMLVTMVAVLRATRTDWLPGMTRTLIEFALTN